MTVPDGATGNRRPERAAVPGTGRSLAPAVVADLVAVLTFAIIGMNTHGTLLLELGRVAWPFAVGAAAGWLWTRAWRDPARIWPSGVAIWLTTVALGMTLRVVAGGSFALSFLLVTTAFLGVTMLGWRTTAVLIRRGTPPAAPRTHPDTDTQEAT